MPAPTPKNKNLLASLICCAVGVLLAANGLTALLGNRLAAIQLVSDGLWQRLARLFSITKVLELDFSGGNFALISYTKVLFALILVTAISGTLGSAWIARRRDLSFQQAAARWMRYGWYWWILPAVWDFTSIAALTVGLDSLASLVNGTPQLWLAVALAGWLATFVYLLLGDDGTAASGKLPAPGDSKRVPWKLIAVIGVYVVVFTAMNWQLYFGLLIPHGDSAMYEEHLWNLEHGKGFRSYLDQGLFLGEHIQVIHLLLIPLHLLWPSHLLLELCESLAFGLGALPVYWMTRRQTGSSRAAFFLATTYLLYVPLHFLDIAIDLKTFRPISFGVPLMLFALDALDRRRWTTMAVFLILTLAAKEDFSTVFAVLGLWIAFFDGPSRDSAASKTASTANPSSRWKTKLANLNWGGLALSVASVLYLALVILVFIPAFRSGENVHYARYFGELGNTPGDVARSFFSSPGLVLGKLFSQRSLLYVLLLLLPLGCLPLLSPSRLAVALPLGAVLCLLELTHDPAQQGMQMMIPFHHFHAPLIPILFWAAAAGLGNVYRKAKSESPTASRTTEVHPRNRITRLLVDHRGGLAMFACTSALSTGLFLGYSPLSISFWDSHSSMYWGRQYVPGKRAELFPRVFEQIPLESRVASTDQIHVRFTHHERSYDYSGYVRMVNNDQVGAPADTDYIVIDTQHPYAKIKSPDQIPEYRDHPDEWELLPDVTEGYFIILKRRPNP